MIQTIFVYKKNISTNKWTSINIEFKSNLLCFPKERSGPTIGPNLKRHKTTNKETKGK